MWPFFTNPLLRALEERLWEKARLRYIEEGNSPIEDVKTLDRETRARLKAWVAEWRAREDKWLKPVWKEFKKTLAEQVAKALEGAFSASDQAWYSAEISGLAFPDVIAVPIEVLKRKTEEVLAEQLAEKIQFKDMLPETRRALAKYAVDREFSRVLNDARREYKSFKIGERYDPFIIVDVLERDFYHLGTNPQASRIDMVILSVYQANWNEGDKTKHKGERAAVERWAKFKPQRRDDRRFTGSHWGFKDAEIDAMARE